MSGDLFDGPSWRDIRPQDMIEELDREIKVRRRVYPRWVENGKLDPVTADRRILTLQAIKKRLLSDEPEQAPATPGPT